MENTLEVFAVTIHDEKSILLALVDMTAAAAVHRHSQTGDAPLGHEGVHVFGLSASDVEVDFDEKRSVLVRLDFGGQSSFGGLGGSGFGCGVDLSEPSDSDRFSLSVSRLIQLAF